MMRPLSNSDRTPGKGSATFFGPAAPKRWQTPPPPARGRRGFTTLDVVVALSLVVVLSALLARTVHDQRRAATAAARVRHAVDRLEAAAAQLRAGEPVDASIIVEEVDGPWLRLTTHPPGVLDGDGHHLYVAEPGDTP